jgi:hypothetical protein
MTSISNDAITSHAPHRGRADARSDDGGHTFAGGLDAVEDHERRPRARCGAQDAHRRLGHDQAGPPKGYGSWTDRVADLPLNSPLTKWLFRPGDGHSPS